MLGFGDMNHLARHALLAGFVVALVGCGSPQHTDHGPVVGRALGFAAAGVADSVSEARRADRAQRRREERERRRRRGEPPVFVCALNAYGGAEISAPSAATAERRCREAHGYRDDLRGYCRCREL